MRYRKKPITIEALQWKGDNDEEMTVFVGSAGSNFEISYPDNTLTIATLEGDHLAQIGDYIIKGIKGEFYPCKPDIFEASYNSNEISKSYLTLDCKDEGKIASHLLHDDFDGVRVFTENRNLSRIEIDLQSAPISEVGIDGMQIEDTILIIAEIIKSFNHRFPCYENSIVITKLEEAHLWCLKRKMDRETRKVEGTNTK